MKGVFYMLALLVISSCSENTASREAPALLGESSITSSQTNPSKALRDVRDIRSMEDIMKEYAHITSELESSRLDSASFSYDCHEERKGTVTYYSEKSQLRMVRHTYSEYSHFSAVDSYYMKEGALFFVLHNRLTWSFMHQGQTRDNVTENRVYFIGGKPVKCLQKNFTTYSSTKGAPQSEQIANRDVACSSLGPVQKDFQFLVKYRSQRENLECLER